MRIKTDENIPGLVVGALREDGHDVSSVRDQGLTGASDGQLARACLDEARVLLSLDVEFADIRRFPPRQHAGLIVLRPGHSGPRHAARIVASIRDRLLTDDVRGSLWIVTEDRIRVRDDDAP